MEDFIFYLVIAVIGFISWIWRKAQEAAAERQRIAAESRARRRGEVIEQRNEPSPSSTEAMSPEETVRKLYEALGGAPAPAPQPPAIPQQRQVQKPPPAPQIVAPTPEPSPITFKKVKTRELSAVEQAALERVKQGDLDVRKKRRKRGLDGTNGPLSAVALVRSTGGLREAIVLKEILDKPLSMRS